jgi:hypothetical protein
MKKYIPTEAADNEEPVGKGVQKSLENQIKSIIKK